MATRPEMIADLREVHLAVLQRACEAIGIRHGSKPYDWTDAEVYRLHAFIVANPDVPNDDAPSHVANAE